MHFMFQPSVESNVQEKRDLEEKLVSCIQKFLFDLLLCLFFSLSLFFLFLHDF